MFSCDSVWICDNGVRSRGLSIRGDPVHRFSMDPQQWHVSNILFLLLFIINHVKGNITIGASVVDADRDQIEFSVLSNL